MNSMDRLRTYVWPHLAIIGAVLWILPVAWVFAGYPTTREMQDEVGTLNRELATVRAENEALMTNIESLRAEIAELNAVILGQVQPELKTKTRPVTSAAEWQRNRDQEILRRLAALEAWRLTQDAPR